MNEWILLRRRRWVRWENTFRGLLCNWRPPPPWKELYNFVIRIPSNMVLFSHPPTLYFTCAYSAFRSRVATRRSNYVCWSWVTLMYIFNTCVPRQKQTWTFELGTCECWSRRTWAWPPQSSRWDMHRSRPTHWEQQDPCDKDKNNKFHKKWPKSIYMFSFHQEVHQIRSTCDKG